MFARHVKLFMKVYTYVLSLMKTLGLVPAIGGLGQESVEYLDMKWESLPFSFVVPDSLSAELESIVFDQDGQSVPAMGTFKPVCLHSGEGFWLRFDHAARSLRLYHLSRDDKELNGARSDYVTFIRRTSKDRP